MNCRDLSELGRTILGCVSWTARLGGPRLGGYSHRASMWGALSRPQRSSTPPVDIGFPVCSIQCWLSQDRPHVATAAAASQYSVLSCP